MKLETYMAKKRMKDADMAALTGAHPSTIWRIRKEQQLPDWPLVRSIMDATRNKVTANDFVPPSKDDPA